MIYSKLRRYGLLFFALASCRCILAQTPGTLATPTQEPAAKLDDDAKKRVAEEQLKQQERQRILGVIPEFNTTNNPDAVALSPKQKLELAMKSTVDPFVFGIDALDAGVSQLENEFPEYGQGTQGYFKRFGASYADGFDGTLIGNALLPILLHEDPRYFRKGIGSVKARTWYAVESTFRCKSDSGRWVPNFSNVLGNLAAGGISNLYYPASERGTELTLERALTVTAEGALGALGYEFWPDAQRYLRNRHNRHHAAVAPK